MKKTKTVILTVLMAILLFSITVFAEKKLVKTTATVNVVVANEDIQEGTSLKESDFHTEEKPVTRVTDDMVKSLNGLNGFYSTQNIYKGEDLNKNRIADKDNNSKPYLKSGEVEISIPISKFESDVFVGTLRRDDKVDISHTITKNDSNGTDTDGSIVGKKVRVIGAVNSQGKFLGVNDNNQVATSVIFAGTEEDFLDISKDMASGTFRVAKCAIAK